MQNDLDYSTVPYTFLHCINNQCRQGDNCLRQKVMRSVTPNVQSISIINPLSVPDNGENCPHFHLDKKSQFARGITHLLDDIPHTKAILIRRELYDYFKKNTYYRILHKERLINPDEQRYIRRIFLDKGINQEPAFDEYVEQYEW